MDHLRRRLALIALAGAAEFADLAVANRGDGGQRHIERVEHRVVLGRIFNSFLILFSVIVMLLSIGAMTQTIIELELNQFFGKRRIKIMIDKEQLLTGTAA